jgi:hypothetical protein
MNQRECRAGHFLLAGRAQAADNAFRQRGLPCPEFSIKKNQQRGAQLRRQLPAESERLFSACSDQRLARS